MKPSAVLVASDLRVVKVSTVALKRATRLKDDEYYTPLDLIKEELVHYKAQFKNKVVYCPCDDPRYSQFVYFFLSVFNEWKIKRLICTNYSLIKTRLGTGPLFNPQARSRGSLLDVTEVTDVESAIKGVKSLKGNGDFRSEECFEYFKVADIVVTNPPFSLVREMIDLLVHVGCKYLILAPLTSVQYLSIFPKLQLGLMQCGYNSRSTAFYSRKNHDNQNVLIVWLTNLRVKAKPKLPLVKRDVSSYEKYDTYNAIEVPTYREIPDGYAGIMGLPITVLPRLNFEQFELLGLAKTKTPTTPAYVLFTPIINGRTCFTRIVLRRRAN